MLNLKFILKASEMHRTNDISEKIDTLNTQHQILDDKFVLLEADHASDQFRIQRIKRQKLLLKNKVSRLQTSLLPNIIAQT